MNSFVVEVIFLYVAPVEVNKNEDQRTATEAVLCCVFILVTTGEKGKRDRELSNVSSPPVGVCRRIPFWNQELLPERNPCTSHKGRET